MSVCFSPKTIYLILIAKTCFKFSVEKEQTEGTKNSAGKNNTWKRNSNTNNNKSPKKAVTTIQKPEITKNQELSTHPVRAVAKRTTPRLRPKTEKKTL